MHLRQGQYQQLLCGAASKLWHYKSKTWVAKAWYGLPKWGDFIDSHPPKKVAEMIGKHLLGSINAVVLGASNAGAESVNSWVQAIKRRANGHRDRNRFRDAIL